MEAVFPLDDLPDYEPLSSTSIAALAKTQGRDAQEVLYDILTRDNGETMCLLTQANYAYRNGDTVREMFLLLNGAWYRRWGRPLPHAV